jgi:hypothetical protein
MEKLKTGYSTNKDVSVAVSEVKTMIGSMNTKMVVFFASSAFDPGLLSRTMKEAFPSAVAFGCTTAGEIVTGKMLKGSLVAMAFSPEVVSDVAVSVVKGIKEEAIAPKVEEAFASFAKHYGSGMQELDCSQYAGLILVDGLSIAEEKIMDRIGDLTNVTFIGGSAGDDLKFERTYVFANGEAYTDAAVLALLKTTTGFDIIKTQSFYATGKRLTATEVNEATREVISFNNKPAAVAYAEALGTTVEDAPNQFMSHPLGLLAGEEIFVRSPQQIKDGKMVFYCNVIQGTELALLNSTNIISDTKQALKARVGNGSSASGIINFNCILRTLELENDKLTDSYGNLFSDVPTVGFSTYGEEYVAHINQTATMLLLK